MTISARKTAPHWQIPSYYEFALHRPKTSEYTLTPVLLVDRAVAVGINCDTCGTRAGHGNPPFAVQRRCRDYELRADCPRWPPRPRCHVAEIAFPLVNQYRRLIEKTDYPLRTLTSGRVPTKRAARGG